MTSINTFNEGHLMVTVLTEVVSNFGVAFLSRNQGDSRDLHERKLR